MNIDKLRKELETLLADLAKTDVGEAASGDHKDETVAAIKSAVGEKIGEYSEALRNLSDQLSNSVDEAGEAVGDHPFVAITAAFLLGVAVGRISRL